jgi:hypothetical protein
MKLILSLKRKLDDEAAVLQESDRDDVLVPPWIIRNEKSHRPRQRHRLSLIQRVNNHCQQFAVFPGSRESNQSPSSRDLHMADAHSDRGEAEPVPLNREKWNLSAGSMIVNGNFVSSVAVSSLGEA